MAPKEIPDSEVTMYQLHCVEEFRTIKDRLDKIDSRMWAIAGGVIIELIGIILLLIFQM